MNEPTPENTAFPVRISRKLSLLFSLLFFLVLLVGGTSLYLARSIFLTSREVQKESEQIDLVDRMHYTSHHLTEALERASLQVASITEDGRRAYIKEFRSLLRRYRDEAGAEKQEVTEFREAIRELDDASEDIVKQLGQSPGKSPNRRDLLALAAIEGKSQALAHRLNVVHRAKMEQMVGETPWKMQVILWVYGGFVFVGACLIFGSSIFFSRVIAQPLRSLAQAAEEIAQGNLSEKKNAGKIKGRNRTTEPRF